MKNRNKHLCKRVTELEYALREIVQWNNCHERFKDHKGVLASIIKRCGKVAENALKEKENE